MLMLKADLTQAIGRLISELAAPYRRLLNKRKQIYQRENQVPPYNATTQRNAATFLVNGKPSTGESPLEKLLDVVFACWKLGSILAVLLAFFTSPASQKLTLVCPLVYHFILTYTSVFYLEAGWVTLTQRSDL